MSKVEEQLQGGFPTYIFKCYCGEHSFLEVMQDLEDRELYINITQHPTRLKERLTTAWRALRGLEFSSSNEVIIDEKDIDRLMEALKINPTNETEKDNG